MDHGFEYAESICPTPWRVYGVTLKPFSLGHKILLEGRKSPLLYGDVAQVKDISLAVLVCSLPFEKAEKALFKVGWLMRFRILVYSLLATINRDYGQTCYANLLAYISEATGYRPKVWKDSKRLRPGVIPETLTVRLALHTNTNYSDSEIMNLPFQRAVIEYYALLDRDGLVRFRDPAKEDFFNRIKEKQKGILERQ